jgi:hypothetical protein
MEKAVDLAITESEVDPDVLEAGAEGSAMIDNLLSQLDSSVYTNIFVPTEGDEFGPTAEKYRQQVCVRLRACLPVAAPPVVIAGWPAAATHKSRSASARAGVCPTHTHTHTHTHSRRLSGFTRRL